MEELAEMIKFFHTLAGCFLALLAGCAPEGLDNESEEYPGLVHETFIESRKSFPNPERGFDHGRNRHPPYTDSCSRSGLQGGAGVKEYRICSSDESSRCGVGLCGRKGKEDGPCAG